MTDRKMDEKTKLEKRRIYSRLYYARNRKKFQERTKAWRMKNREAWNKYYREYYHMYGEILKDQRYLDRLEKKVRKHKMTLKAALKVGLIDQLQYNKILQRRCKHTKPVQLHTHKNN